MNIASFGVCRDIIIVISIGGIIRIIVSSTRKISVEGINQIVPVLETILKCWLLFFNEYGKLETFGIGDWVEESLGEADEVTGEGG